MSRLENITNLRLAWRRILTAQNYAYRNLQRLELESFSWGAEEYLSQLRDELRTNAFNPSETTKIFIPKPSGLLRPITILTIKDSVVYQAIANLIADKARKKHSSFYFGSVFSNVLTADPKQQYFFRSWKYCRRQLSIKRKDAFNNGYVWLGKMDLASFFDIIDHQLLHNVLLRMSLDSNIIDLLTNCLAKWTKYPGGEEHGHGVPQGPLPSGLLAECVLHTLDKRMDNLSESIYMRYVDDITIMSSNKKELQRQFARTELTCRQLGLVPVIKSEIHKINSIEDLMVDEPSPPTSITDFPESEKRLPKAKNDPIRKQFLNCFEGEELKYQEELVTKLRFSLFRMNPDKRILKKVFKAFEKLPCIYDAVNYYVRRFGKSKEICSHFVQYLEDEPIYATVAASCIETLYNACNLGLYGRLRKICIKALSHSHNVILRCSATKVLSLRKAYIKGLKTMLRNTQDAYLTQQLLFSLCDISTSTENETRLNQYIRSSVPNVAITACYLLTRENLKLVGSRTNINPVITPVLLRYGLIKKKVTGDRLGEILKRRYSLTLPALFSFRKKLRQSEYKQALLHLNHAEGAFDMQRSAWVVQMDCLNQIVLYMIFNRKLRLKIDYGNVFASIDSKKLKANFPTIASTFKSLHKRRSSSYQAHAYSIEQKKFATDLKIKERNKLFKELKSAYQELANQI